MRKYSLIRRNLKLNIASAILLGVFSLGLIVFTILRMTDWQTSLLVLAAPMFLAWVAVSTLVQLMRPYHIEDDGVAIHKVFREGKRQTLQWNEVVDVRVHRYRNQVQLSNHDGTNILIDTQLNNFDELFAKIQERFPDLPYKLK